MKAALGNKSKSGKKRLHMLLEVTTEMVHKDATNTALKGRFSKGKTKEMIG